MRKSILAIDLICRIFHLSLLIFLSAISWIIVKYDYQQFVDHLLIFIDQVEFKNYFQSSLFPIHRYKALQGLVLSTTTILGVSTWFIQKRIGFFAEAFVKIFNESVKSIQLFLKNIQSLEWKFILLIVLIYWIRSIWMMLEWELTYDEAWTYNHFISKGLVNCLFNPHNNHILYSTLAWFTDFLMGNNKIALRIPAFFFGFSGVLLFYYLLRKFVQWPLAILGLVLFSLSPSVVFYSFMARGYSQQLFFLVLSLIWVHHLLKFHIISKRWSIGWILIHIFGYFSIATHLIYFLFIHFYLAFHFLIFNQFKVVKGLILSFILTILGIMILNIPYFLTGGFDKILLTKAFQSNVDHMGYLANLYDWILLGLGKRGDYIWGFYLAELFFALYFIRRIKHFSTIDRAWVSISLMLLQLPVLAIFLGIVSPFRIWHFLIVFIVLPVVLSLKNINTDSVFLGISLILIPLFLWYVPQQHYFLNWGKQLDKDIKKMSQLMIDNGIDACYFISRYDKELVRYYYNVNDLPLDYAMYFKDSKYYQAFDEQNYPALVYETNRKHLKPLVYEQLITQYDELLFANDRIELRVKSR